eukprot:12413001-Ditylum_brightwellii.AAC.1
MSAWVLNSVLPYLKWTFGGLRSTVAPPFHFCISADVSVLNVSDAWENRTQPSAPFVIWCLDLLHSQLE